MTEATKYLFENSFESAERRAEKETAPPPPTYSEEELATARAQAFEDGRNAGIAEHQAGLDEAAASLLGRIADQLTELANTYGAEFESQREYAAQLAIRVGQLLARELIELRPTGEIEGIVRDCLAELRSEPKFLVYTNPELHAVLEEKFTELPAQVGTTADIVVVSDADIGFGDCRIEWSAGVAVRDADGLYARIEDIVRRRFSGDPQGASSQPPNHGEVATDTPDDDNQEDLPHLPSDLQERLRAVSLEAFEDGAEPAPDEGDAAAAPVLDAATN